MSTLLSSPLTVTLLSSVALAITVRLFYHGIGARGLPGCGPHSGCDEVTRSRWSRCGRVPVASLGSLMYLMACIASLLTTVSRSVVWERTAWLVLISLVPLLVSSALWFTALQLLVIRRMCRWCTIAHALSLLISVFVLYGAREYGRHSRVGGDFITQHWAVQIPGAMALALLIGLQILIKPPTYAIFRVPEPPSPFPSPQPQRTPDPAPLERLIVPFSQPSLPPNPFAGRTITAAEGRIVLPGDSWPVLGSPRATHILLYLFDYTCKECRYVHGLLNEMIERYPAELAVMVVPVPRDPACNPTVRTREPEHTFACAYTRLGLSVWRENWSKYPEFDRYMFKNPHPPLLGQARVLAVELVGPQVPDPEAPNSEIDARIRAAIDLFKSAGTNIAPTLLLPQRALAGRPPSADHLYRILQHYLRLGAANLSAQGRSD